MVFNYLRTYIKMNTFSICLYVMHFFKDERPEGRLANPRGPHTTGVEAREQIPDGIAHLRKKATAPLDEVSNMYA